MATTVLARPATQSHSRRADIQGLRAIAVIMVLVFHAGLPLPGGFAGVDVFFVISGFVITLLLTRELRSTGRLRLGRFYARRAKRLMPALALTTVFTGLAAIVVLPLEAQRLTGGTGIAASLFMANMYIWRATGGYFGPAAESDALLHTWSLSVEEQFYFAFPALLLLGWLWFGRRGKHDAGAVAAVSTVVVLSLALSLYLSAGGSLPLLPDSQEFAFYSSATRAWEFGAGALLALAAQRANGHLVASPQLARAGVWLGTGLMVLAMVTLTGGPGYPGLAAFLPVIATLLLLATADHQHLWIGRFLQSRPMVQIGELSYSLYLWHWPFVVIGLSLLHGVWEGPWTAPLLVLASIVPAYLSYRFVETPLRNADWIKGRRVLALIGVCIAVPIAVSAVLYAGAKSAWGDEGMVRFEQLREAESIGRQNGCHASKPQSLKTPIEDCIFGEGDRGLVYLVGDSHADVLSTPLVESMRDSGYRVAVRSAPACPFLVDGARWRIEDGGSPATCVAANEQFLSEIEQLRPAMVLLVNRSPKYVNPPVKGFDEKGSPTPCPTISEGLACESNEVLAAKWGQSLERTLATINGVGVPVMVMAAVPEHPLPLQECAFWNGLDESCASTEASYPQERRAAVVAAEQSAVAAAEAAFYWDPFDVFCTDGTCVRDADGLPLYRDEDHVSTSSGVVLDEPLRRALDEALTSFGR